MSVKTRILIVEHDTSDLELLHYELKKGDINYISEIVQNEHDYCNALKNFSPDIILSDYSLPSFDGPTAFKMREQLAPHTPFIFVSGNIGEENSIEFIKNGVTDYALKDKLFTLTTKVKRALKESKEKQQKNRTEQELIQSESRLNEAEAIAHIGNWEINVAEKSHIWSNEMYKIFGINKNEVTPTRELYLSFIQPDDYTYASDRLDEAFINRQNGSFDFRFIRKDLAPRYGYTEWRFAFDKSGKAIRIFGIIQDVTERKQAETERIKMVSDLEQRNKDLEQFAYIVSHNLRAPVANILGAASGLKYPGLSARQKDMLSGGINESVTKLDNVVKDLNYVLQVKGQINEVKEKVRFSELVDDIKISIKNLIDKDHIVINYDFSEVAEFLTLKSYLYSVFYNLISNSIKYRQQLVPSIIEIKSHRLKSSMELIFTDNGMGIDLKKKGDQVFGLYKRFHTNVEGKGMGLFMVKTQVETLGGKISIKSEVNRGTEFKIEFENEYR